MDKRDIRRIAKVQKRNLECWLQEWNIEQELERDDTACEGVAEGGTLHGRPREGAVVEVKQIRLLYPDCRASWRRPVYLALIENRQEGGFLAAPFSRFSYPALPGELATGMDDAPLRVVSLWCAREFKASRLALGWQVDSLSEAQLVAARAVYRWIGGGADVPAATKARIGPPLTHPLDPRWDYREEELEFMESLHADAEPAIRKMEYGIKELPAEYRSKAADSPDAPEEQ